MQTIQTTATINPEHQLTIQVPSDIPAGEYKFVLVYALVPANTDERVAAEAVLCFVKGCNILGDKGFIGGDW
jgi:hypothetical protein